MERFKKMKKIVIQGAGFVGSAFAVACAGAKNNNQYIFDVSIVEQEHQSKLIGKINQEGLTIIPTKMYFFKGKVKIDLAVAKGKKLFDKRQEKKNRDWNRDKARIFSKNN